MEVKPWFLLPYKHFLNDKGKRWAEVPKLPFPTHIDKYSFLCETNPQKGILCGTEKLLQLAA